MSRVSLAAVVTELPEVAELCTAPFTKPLLPVPPSEEAPVMVDAEVAVVEVEPDKAAVAAWPVLTCGWEPIKLFSRFQTSGCGTISPLKAGLDPSNRNCRCCCIPNCATWPPAAVELAAWLSLVIVLVVEANVALFVSTCLALPVAARLLAAVELVLVAVL